MKNIKNSTNVRVGNFRVQVMVNDKPMFLASTKSVVLAPVTMRHKGFKSSAIAQRAIDNLPRLARLGAKVVPVATAEIAEDAGLIRLKGKGRLPKNVKIG